MPIDPNFRMNRVYSTFEKLQIWQDRSSSLGIYGTNVAVDFDLCVGDGACVEVCPVNVFEWQGSGIERKPLPSKESDCIYCLGCEAVCPKFAIRVSKP